MTLSHSEHQQRTTRRSDWPVLQAAAARPTYETLHMWLQIVGKTRLALSPMLNHWWQIALYVTPRGLTTSAIPADGATFSVDLDFFDHELRISTDGGLTRSVPLIPRSVAAFYDDYCRALHALKLAVRIRPIPVETEVAIPFAEDEVHRTYDAHAAQQLWRAFVEANRVFNRFRARFIGKASPVHLFWGSFDLAATRFSGRTAPRHAGGAPNCPDYVMVEAYSHECTSCGFWPGGAESEPVFYSYAYPEPEDFRTKACGPAAARYDSTLREFILPYDAVRSSDSPDDTLLEFLQSTYEAAAQLGEWDRLALERPTAEWP